jgi:hypothetical protein
VALQDVRILVDSSTLQQHVQYFSQQGKVKTYTVSSDFWACLPCRLTVWLAVKGVYTEHQCSSHG